MYGCVLKCVQGRSQAWPFVMSSLGSFWFSCSSPLFHAAVLSNSSGPVSRVLPLFLCVSLHLKISSRKQLVCERVCERGGGERGNMHEWSLPLHTIHSIQGRQLPFRHRTSPPPFPPKPPPPPLLQASMERKRDLSCFSMTRTLSCTHPLLLFMRYE